MPYVLRTYSGEFSGLEGEVDYRIHFHVLFRGCPARGADMSGPGSPAEPPEVNITTIEVEVDGEWQDIEATYSPQEIEHLFSWAENEDISDKINEYLQDEAEAAAEFRRDLREDR
jgi:hypothetical protein